MATAQLLGRTATTEDNKIQVNLEKGVIVSRSNLEEEKHREVSERSCSNF